MNKTLLKIFLIFFALNTSIASKAAVSDALPNSEDARFILRSLIVFAAVQMYSPASTIVSRWVYGPTEKEKLQEHALKNETLKYVAALPEITEQLKTNVEKSAKDFEERLTKRLEKVKSDSTISNDEKEKILTEMRQRIEHNNLNAENALNNLDAALVESIRAKSRLLRPA